MCGIAGIVNYSNNQSEMRETLTRMIGYMNHRGPDASGILLSGPAGLAHARLSIIDLAGGDQPIHNENKTIWVVFNGEIFNYPEIREELKACGHTFYTRSDTEVLVHLYEEYGESMCSRLNGQFAFAIWDKRAERLFLARDRMGVRPLFYYQGNAGLVFGSEIKAIFADNKVPRKMDLQSLSDTFICWSSLGAATPFENVFQLQPGHYAVYSKGNMRIRPYWRLSYNRITDRTSSLEEWTEELKVLFYDAVRIRLRADVPVGTYLSGGLDSTYITSLVKKKFNNLLSTFSISFTDERFDESTFQSIAAESLETEHRVIKCTDKDIGAVFPRVIWHTEAPVLRTSPAPLFMLSRLVRDSNFKVVLTGEGADEVFAGYNIFKEDRVRRFWAREPDSTMRPRLLERLYPYIFEQGGRASAFLEGFFKRDMEKTDRPEYSHILRWRNTSQLKTFFTRDFIVSTCSDIDSFIERFTRMLPSEFMSWDPLDRAQYTESTIFMSNYLLCSQGDRMAMANSVEGRFPFLDHRVVEFATQLPPRYRLNGLTEKYILKRAAQELIPHEIVKRPKQPYRAPISKSFTGYSLDYVDELLSEKGIKAGGYFDYQKVAALLLKCKRQDGKLLSERENMALVGIISTQLLDHLFIKQFPKMPEHSVEPQIYNA